MGGTVRSGSRLPEQSGYQIRQLAFVYFGIKTHFSINYCILYEFRARYFTSANHSGYSTVTYNTWLEAPDPLWIQNYAKLYSMLR